MVVGRTGFEPATPWSQTKYSTELNYLPSYFKELYLCFVTFIKTLNESCEKKIFFNKRRDRDANPG